MYISADLFLLLLLLIPLMMFIAFVEATDALAMMNDYDNGYDKQQEVHVTRCLGKQVSICGLFLVMKDVSNHSKFLMYEKDTHLFAAQD